MKKIFCLLGKSGSGKDTLYAELKKDSSLNLQPLITYTTRPARLSETNGTEYHFITGEQWNTLPYKLVEERMYNTVQGIWRYGTFDDGNLSPDRNTLCIITPETLPKYREAYGENRIFPFYIEVDDKTRLLRAIEREARQPGADYSELCRRFLADQVDFSSDVLAECRLARTFRNDSLSACILEIKEAILSIQ